MVISTLRKKYHKPEIIFIDSTKCSDEDCVHYVIMNFRLMLSMMAAPDSAVIELIKSLKLRRN
jgi:hypothetical protein